ncbi:hypothetical protein GCM10010466_27700 [Planomonospora alba]|uniref:FXSXX-COOH protein n=1 Tax=Planomonospora alba TaxID=161354 RepID=A0ABP6N4V8_9ACTN
MGEEAVKGPAGTDAGIIDVNGIPLSELAGLDDSVLDHALRRVLEKDNTGPVAGFSASI